MLSVDVVDGYGGVAIRAVIRIRNGKGKKNDPASDDLLQIFSLKPEWYLVDPIAFLMGLGIRTGAIDGHCLTTSTIVVRPEWLQKPVFLNVENSVFKHYAGFTESPLISNNASDIVSRFGTVARLTRPISAHDIRRGFVQDVKFSSDSRTASGGSRGCKDQQTLPRSWTRISNGLGL